MPVTEAQLEATRDDDLYGRTNGLAPPRDLQELKERRKARGAVQADDDAPQAKIPRGGDWLVDTDIAESRWNTLKATMLLEGQRGSARQLSESEAPRQLSESDAPRHRGPPGGNE